MRKYSSLTVCFFFSALIIQAQTFVNGQAARAVLGQTNFTAGNPNASQQILGGASGLAYSGGILYVADSNRAAASPNNSRVMAFQTAEVPKLRDNLGNDNLTNSDCYLCGFPAVFSLGQSTFSPPSGNVDCSAADVSLSISPCFYTNLSQSGMANATGVATDGHYFAVADTDNNRVLLWNEIPNQMNQNADIVLGQANFTAFKVPPSPTYVDKYTMRGPQGVWIQNNHLFVADTQDNRVLIWNTIPTQNNQAPDLVLGQNDFNSLFNPTTTDPAPPTAANQLLNPISVTADATHLYVADLGHNRVLIWNEIPTQMDQGADIVVGQPDMSQTRSNNPNVCSGYITGPLQGQCETSLNQPRYALPINGQLFVADGGNDRVLIYNNIPTSNGKNATGVLGEPDFQQDIVSSASISIASTAIDNTGGVDLLPTPSGLAWDGNNLYVSDPYNRRVLIFTPGDSVLPTNSVVNWASEIVRQEGIVQITYTSGVTALVVGDTVSVTVNGQSPYTYTIVKGDTLGTIAQALVNLINKAPDQYVTAIYAGFDTTSNTSELYVSSIQTDLPYDSITLTAAASNPNNLTVTASGGYLSSGSAATGAIGMLVEVDGTNLSDTTANATLDGVTVIPNSLGGVQVYMDGYASPILKVSPTQIVTQIPYAYQDRNSTSVYVRTVHSDGSVTSTNAVPVYIAPANPGIFNAPSYAGQPRPWPISQAYHQPGNATTVIDFEGTPVLNNIAIIVINGTSYQYTVNSTDVTSATLTSIVQGIVNVINTSDPNVTASVGGAFNRVVLTAKQAGAAGVGITVTASSQVSSTNTAAGSVTLTTYSSATCCLVTPGSPIIPANPAAPGELITVTAAGLGLVTDSSGVAQTSLNTGVPYNGPTDNNVQNYVTATMTGPTTAQVIYAYLPQGSYGTYNVQLVVPASVATSNTTTLNIAQNAFISNTVTIPTGPPVLYTQAPPSAPATTISEVIESPTAGSTVSGVLYAAGWALNSASTLSAVNVSVDGNFYAAAGIHYTRNDVCAAFSSPDCPGTGWYLPIDTTQFADGQHTIAITAVSSNGADYTISQSFNTLNNASPATNPFHGVIESPSANFSYRGTAPFSGWTTYSQAAIAGVSIYVDGSPRGSAVLTPRTDVCAAYPSPGCPNVGWYFQFNTNLVADGTHTLVAKAISMDGHTFATSQTFQVGNFAGNSSTTFANIESPSAGAAPFSGILSIGGWAGDLASQVTSIAVAVDGVSYGNAQYGFARPDVCSGLGLQNCPGPGFFNALDTTLLADGQHTLTLVLNLSSAQSVTYSQSFSVANQATTANPIRGNIDAPASGAAVSGTVQASGWAISDADAITSITLRVDGTSYGSATYGAPRPDVCSVYSGAVSCPNVGWYANINTSLLGNGTHILEITMATAAGHRASTNSSFSVNNPVTGPGIVFLESPSPSSSPFTGIALFSGWALNTANTKVTSVSVSVDGIPYGTANYGSTPRPDVCAIYTSLNCPDVGWTFATDTTKLSDGTHTISVTENSADGTYDTSESTFTVANYTTVNPTRINIESPGATFGVYGALTISGWAFNANSSISAIDIAIDGVPVGSAVYGIARTDVCSAYPGNPGCPNVGWYLNYNTALLPNGTHTLDVTAVTATGQSSTSSKQFVIGN